MTVPRNVQARSSTCDPLPHRTHALPDVCMAIFLYYTFLLLFYALNKSTGTCYIVWRGEFPLWGRDPNTSADQDNFRSAKLSVLFRAKVSPVRGELPCLRLEPPWGESRLSNYHRSRVNLITKAGIRAHVWSPGVTKPGAGNLLAINATITSSSNSPRT